jgi:hypothetical protein
MLVACRLAGLSALEARPYNVMADETLAVGPALPAGPETALDAQRGSQTAISRFRRSKHRETPKVVQRRPASIRCARYIGHPRHNAETAEFTPVAVTNALSAWPRRG